MVYSKGDMKSTVKFLLLRSLIPFQAILTKQDVLHAKLSLLFRICKETSEIVHRDGNLLLNLISPYNSGVEDHFCCNKTINLYIVVLSLYLVVSRKTLKINQPPLREI